MNLSTEQANGISIVRVGESRLMYPLLSEFSTVVTQLLAAGEKKVVVDLSGVGYVDSATIGCLMDLYRQASAAGGSLKLSGVQKRVETMLTMTGAQNFIEVHPDELSAVKSFGA
ncbi:MAG: STAS domain-containing protein [Vicinamibacterales bacterium]|jgi:anti-anti-sigma factor